MVNIGSGSSSASFFSSTITLGSSGEAAIKVKWLRVSWSTGCPLLSGNGMTEKMYGGGIGGPEGPRPKPSRSCQKEEDINTKTD